MPIQFGDVTVRVPLIFSVLVSGIFVPAYSQDMGVLDRHLEHQQSVRVQDHQNRMRSPNGTSK